MFNKTTARYWAKQAYQLRLMTGREMRQAKQGTIRFVYEPGLIIVLDTTSSAWFAFKPAKAWTNL